MLSNFGWTFRTVNQSTDANPWPEAPSYVHEAAERCKNPYVSEDRDKFYFCLRGPKSRGPRTNRKTGEVEQPTYENNYHIQKVNIDLLDTPGGFVEYAVELKNFYTNQAVSCEQFKKDFKNKTGVDLNDIHIHRDGPTQ